MKSTKISVVIPAFNAEKTIQRALLSVLNQQMLPEEIIIIDDGSCDATAQIAKHCALKCEIPIIVVSTLNQGVSSARNHGISISSSEYIALLDADDEFSQGHIQRMTGAIQKNPEGVLFFAASERRFDNDSEICIFEESNLPDFTKKALKYWPKKQTGNVGKLDNSLLEGLLEGSFIPLCTVVFPKLVNKQTINFNTKLSYGEDHDFLIRLISQGSVYFINQVGGIIHRDGANVSSLGNTIINSRRRIESYIEISSIDFIRRDENYAKTVALYINSSVSNYIYHSSFQGIYSLVDAVKFSLRCPCFDVRKHFVPIFKNVLRSSFYSVKNALRRII